MASVGLVSVIPCIATANDNEAYLPQDERLLNYPYSDTWTGTSLPLLDLSDACTLARWDMARWPDPILRRPASPIQSSWFGTNALHRTTQLLERTARDAKAVGLAAQQCGINARMIYLEEQRPWEDGVVMVNPKIANRSEEQWMRVWQENCLVLPPTFVATVLRDAWVDVEYWDWQGKQHHVRLRGEAARAMQHELDHDRGILTLDHVGLEEMENDKMRAIERKGHDERMAVAYSRGL